MIVDERIVSFINSFNQDEEGIAEEIRKEALQQEVPIIRRETGQFIKTLLEMNKPNSVLEVGTAVGYSAIFMSKYLPKEAHITTIENWEPRIAQAKINFERAKVTEKITLIEGDATEELTKLKGTFDFIFMDAAKGQYINYFPDILRLLADGGILLSDNVLQDGEVLDSKFVVERRNRTIHGRMRDYLYTLMNHENLVTSILPIGDGVALSVKKMTKTGD
ncbi:MAG: O-methyltransferase [Lachnospiraceae bacterium]|jgi:predicted O-methyltransferase YrrM|nr:O-methyltransferase [Lachnospiraceae bacterium]